MLRHSLRRQLTIVLVATSACALALTGLGLGLYDGATARQSLTREIEALARVVGENSAAALEFEDRTFTQTTLASLQPRDDLRVAALYGKDGKLFTQIQGREGSPAPLTVPPVGVLQTEQFVRVVKDICLHDGCVGSMLLETDLSHVAARRRDTLIIFLCVFLVSLGLAYLLGAALQRPLVTPLRQLSLAADEVMRTERFDMRLPARVTDDEVGVLVRAFNGMLSHLEAREQELQQHRNELDARRRIAPRAPTASRASSWPP